MKSDVYFKMIIGESEVPLIPKIRLIDYLIIAKTVVHARRLFNKLGALQTLNVLTNGIVYKKMSQMKMYLMSRKINTFVNILINFITKGTALCLERSVILCLALRVIGLPAHLVIGSKAAINSSRDYPFHAWVEIDGKPVNETLGVKTQFNELYRYAEGVK